MTRTLHWACLASWALVSAGCGGRAHEETGEGDAIPSLEESVLAEGVDLRFEAISDGGAWVAYSSAGIAGGRDVWVVGTEGGEATRLGSFVELDSARFDGATLLLFRGDGVADGSVGGNDPCSGTACGPDPELWAAELFAWRPNDAGLTSLATDVDPGSVRFSRDGRWISLEANDPPPPNSHTPDILLVDTLDLSVRRIATANLARARFTRQSDWLVFGGNHFLEPAPDIAAKVSDRAACDEHAVMRLSLLDGRVQPVTCYAALLRSRWEISPDGEWLVHPVRLARDYALARTHITGGEPEILATNLSGALRGKSFDVGKGDRSQVAFVRNQTSLDAVPLDPGGVETRLSDASVSEVHGIADHHGSMISYYDADGLRVAPSRGGRNVPLGKEPRVIDERADRLLALDTLGSLHLFQASQSATTLLGEGTVVNAAGFIAGESVLASLGAGAPPWDLVLFDAEGNDIGFGEITGPFGIEPESRLVFVTTRESDGASRLVLGTVTFH